MTQTYYKTHGFRTKKMYLNPTVDHHTLSKNCNIYIFGVNSHRQKSPSLIKSSIFSTNKRAICRWLGTAPLARPPGLAAHDVPHAVGGAHQDRSAAGGRRTWPCRWRDVGRWGSLKDIPSILWILLVGYYGIISKIGNMYDHVANPLFVCQFLHRQLVTAIQFSQGKCFNKHIDEDFR